MQQKLPSIKILGTSITTSSEEEILEYIFKRLQTPKDKFYIVTPNPEMLVYASRSGLFQDVLNSASVSLPDGVGVVIAGSMLKKGRYTRISGVDMIESICARASKGAFTVGFLGGRDGVAEKTAKCLREKYPNLIVSYVGEEWNSSVGVNLGSRGPAVDGSSAQMGPVVAPPPTDNPRFASLTAGARRGAPSASHPSVSITDHQSPNTTSHIDILFVAFGFPKQEEWIARNLPDIDVTAAMGVGGAFDYISGKVPRAPKVIRDIGMEWAFRLVRQPWRAKRQLALPVFVYKVLREKFS